MRYAVLLTIGLLLTLSFSAPAHAYARSYDYVALGASDPLTGPTGILLFPNADDSPYTQAGIPPIGGAVIPGPFALPFVMYVEDDVAQPAVITCFSNPDTDEICGGGREVTCSSAVVLFPAFADELTVFVLNLHSTPELDVCIGTTGTITVP